MIQLARHIEILLLDNDCVIVPGLGGFMAHHVCARYCAETETFLPPMRQLGFNSQLQINDSLLAQSYIEAYDISYPEAITRIESEVRELNQLLQNEGECELNDIGLLKLNIEGNIEFVPCDAGILTPELYGLNYIDIAQLKSHAETTTEQKDINTLSDILKPVPHLSVKATERHTPAEDKEENEKGNADNIPSDITENHDTEYIRIRVSTIRHFATVTAVIIALFVFAIPFGQLSQPEMSQSYIDTGVLYNILPEMKDSGKAISQKKVVFKTANDTSLTSVKGDGQTDDASAADTATEQQSPLSNNDAETPSAKTEKSESHSFFSIVLASRVTRANAQDFVDRLKKDGLDKAQLVERSNGLKVIYGQYPSKEEAQHNLNMLKADNEAFAEGWIMEFRN